MTSESRKFTRRRLMKQIKAERRLAGLSRTDKQVPIGPRPSLLFRQAWKKIRGLDQEE